MQRSFLWREGENWNGEKKLARESQCSWMSLCSRKKSKERRAAANTTSYSFFRLTTVKHLKFEYACFISDLEALCENNRCCFCKFFGNAWKYLYVNREKIKNVHRIIQREKKSSQNISQRHNSTKQQGIQKNGHTENNYCASFPLHISLSYRH